jgi:membrane-bound metal-dependent hydrolase YbcI (DUF457 family)
MFIGHFALGFAAKRVVPHVSLAVLFAAAQLADLLWPILVAVGIEHVRIDPGNTAMTPLDFVSYPYSHSLLFLALWGVMFGWLYRFLVRDGRAFLIISALVLSHWLLDFVTHRPDMPLYPGSPRFGLGLWNSIPGTIAIEVTLYGAGLWLYFRTTEPRDRTGRWASSALAASLVLLYFASLKGAPPSVPALCTASIVGGALLTVWSWWADRHRQSRAAA